MNISRVELVHHPTLIAKHGQEPDEIVYTLLGIAFIHIQLTGIVSHLAQGTVRREVENVAHLFNYLRMIGMQPVAVGDGPRRLHAESRLEIGFWRGCLAKHKNASPRPDRHSCGQLAAGQRYGLAMQWVGMRHGTLYGWQCLLPYASLQTGTDHNTVIVEESILEL